MEFLSKFPVMERTSLMELRKGIDHTFREFSRAYGDGIEAFFDPLLFFLIRLEKLLLATPWPIIMIILGALAWLGSRSWKLVVGSVIAFMLIGYFGMWKDCMATVAIITVCTIMCIAVGIPVGVLMARSNRVEKAIPPVIRLTNLGIREVDKETIEASEAFGATKLQKLRTVQIPLALPTVFAGVNQTIMMALAMVVIASMIGVKGLGVPILRAISNQYLALGLMNGLAIVALAIIFDRITQEYGRRIQKHRGQKK